MNYVLPLSQTQLTHWKSWIEQYALTGKNFVIEEADNGLILQPIVDEDEEDFSLETILKSKKVETDEKGVIYYEDDERMGVHFTEGIPLEQFISELEKIDG
jgi:hypothetical protein